MKKTIIIMALVIFLIPIKALAFNLQTNISEEEIQEGIITISLKISDLQDYTNGINAVSGKLVYDTNMIESVTFKGMNNWSCAYNDEENNENKGNFMLITTSGNVNTDTEVAKIELKLKNVTEQQKTKIKFEDIQTSYHAQKIKAEDKEINLKIEDNKIEIMKQEEQNQKILQDVKQEKKVDYKLISIILMIIILLITIDLIIKFKGRRKINENK